MSFTLGKPRGTFVLEVKGLFVFTFCVCLYVTMLLKFLLQYIWTWMRKKAREKEEACHVATVVQYSTVHYGIILYFTLHHVVRLISTNLKSQPYWAISGEWKTTESNINVFSYSVSISAWVVFPQYNMPTIQVRKSMDFIRTVLWA